MFDDNFFAKVQYTSGPLDPGPLPGFGQIHQLNQGEDYPHHINLCPTPLWILRPSYNPAHKKVKCFAQKCKKIENTRCGNTD